MTFYDEMRGTADELLGEFKQGFCVLSRPGGKTRVVKDLRPIPSAGQPVPYIVFLAA